MGDFLIVVAWAAGGAGEEEGRSSMVPKNEKNFLERPSVRRPPVCPAAAKQAKFERRTTTLWLVKRQIAAWLPSRTPAPFTPYYISCASFIVLFFVCKERSLATDITT